MELKRLTFYLDFISPYAYLAFERLPQALQGISHAVTYQPVLFASMLKAHSTIGPAELAPKRDWTYRQVLWLAHTHGIDLDLPSSHPFNPLAHLRLAVACAESGEPNRYVTETVFRHVWRGGHEAADAQRLQELQALLAPKRAPDDATVKNQLKAHTDEALARCVFGVPTFAVDDKLFWGLDALPMLRAYLEASDAAWFEGPWESAARVVQGIRR